MQHLSMKKIYLIAGMMMAVMTATAQDTYENARMLGYDLNGTARYVGMGGALEALGADISTISTNPAGIGMFRRSSVSMSFGGVNQEGVNKFDNLSKTNLSFDQLGFVYSQRTGDASYINFAFNYHKSRNFDQIIQVNNTFMTNQMGQGGSLSKLAYGKQTFGNDVNGGYDLAYSRTDRKWMGFRNAISEQFAYPFTQWDYLYSNVYNVDDVNNPAGDFLFSEGENYFFDKAHRGWIADYDFNISGNANNRVYWGLTLGLHNVKYRGYSIYDEMMLDGNNSEIGTLVLEDERHIDATGADLKLGFIFLPIEESPFRIGVSVATPTWYEVKTKNWTTLFNRTATPAGYRPWGYNNLSCDQAFEYKYYTPWKFGLSLGHTFSNFLALGASYEYTDYGSADNRVYDGTRDFYGDNNSESDRAMNAHTENTLKGVSLLKLGAEIKPDPSLAIRFGYNYQTAAYNKNGVRNTCLDSELNYYTSTADYVNWEGTNRLTCGIGYKYEGFGIDLAYQYSNTKGTFYPFQPNVGFVDPIPNAAGEIVSEQNVSTPSSLDFKRHQLLLTLSYSF